MNEVIYTIIYAIILVSSLIYIWHKLLNKKINFKDYKLYVTLVSLVIISIFNFFIIDKFIRIVLITIIFMFFFKYLFKENLQKCIITPIYYQIIIMISEFLFAIIVSKMFNYNADIIVSTYLGAFVSNFCVAIISIVIVQFKSTKNIYQWLIKITDKLKSGKLIIFSLFIMICGNIMTMMIYYQIKFEYLVIFNLILVFISITIVIYSLNTQNNYNKVSDKYNVAIKSLNDYEEMMTKYRVANHENKNLLKTIRVMILNKDKNIPEYIDSMVEEKYEVDDKLLFKMSVIPTGGLRATIYSEILKIKENKINYDLNIDRKIKSIDFIELDTNIILDICKVVGVFIDNAIEEAKTIKNKYIGIDLYMEDNNLNIKISNSYKNKIEVDKIFNEGYTTKGQGHGYGLSLVQKIVNNSNVFGNKVEITKEVFSQILIVKIKKNHI